MQKTGVNAKRVAHMPQITDKKARRGNKLPRLAAYLNLMKKPANIFVAGKTFKFIL